MDGGDPVRVALVGAGEIARLSHLPAWAANGGARVEALVDPDVEQARRVAAEFGVDRVEPDLATLLRESPGSVDAVDICAPPHLHRDLTLAALDADLHVLVEKPIATTLEDSVEIERASAASSRIVMVAENWLFSSARRQAEAVIAELQLGAPFLVKAWHESQLYVASEGLVPAWTFSPAQARGGYLMQAGIHTISLLEAMIAPVRRVAAATDQPGKVGEPSLDSTTVLSLQFDTGALGSVALTGRARHVGPRRLGVQMFFEEGTVELDVWTGDVSYTKAGQRTALHTANASMGFHEEIAHFLDCIRSNQEPEASVTRLLGSLRTVLAAYDASASGQWISVESPVSELAPTGAQ